MTTAITPHGGCSAPGRRVSSADGRCSRSQHVTSTQSKHGLPEGGASPSRAKSAPNGGTSASKNLALPAAVTQLLASNIEIGNRHISP
jgi:hypothetical protein